MPDTLVGLDHVVVVVRDLEGAAQAWHDLGFTLSPRGTHSAHMGTGNYTIMLGDDYIELLSRDPASAAQDMARLIDRTATREEGGAWQDPSGDARAAFVFLDRSGLAAGGARRDARGRIRQTARRARDPRLRPAAGVRAGVTTPRSR